MSKPIKIIKCEKCKKYIPIKNSWQVRIKNNDKWIIAMWCDECYKSLTNPNRSTNLAELLRSGQIKIK